MNKNNLKINALAPAAQMTYKRAFTFIEVIVALLIVSISLLALMKLNLVSIRMADRTAAASKAALLAEQKIAEILASGYPDKQTLSGTVEEDSIALQWQTQVTDMDFPIADKTINRLRKVSVDISWEQGKTTKHLQMATCAADRRL